MPGGTDGERYRAQLVDQSNRGQQPQTVISEVDLPPEESLPRRTREVMVIIVPALAKGNEREPEVVAAVVARGVAAAADAMRERQPPLSGVLFCRAHDGRRTANREHPAVAGPGALHPEPHFTQCCWCVQTSCRCSAPMCIFQLTCTISCNFLLLTRRPRVRTTTALTRNMRSC